VENRLGVVQERMFQRYSNLMVLMVRWVVEMELESKEREEN
jgi:hypothetical protein